MIHGRTGSVTQVPVLTMPNDDITHPIPDLTGYITEGRSCWIGSWIRRASIPHRHSPLPVPPDEGRRGQGLHPGGSLRRIQPALCLLLQGAGRRSLASVIGEDELSELDKQYLAFGDAFERKFVHQSLVENRTIAETLDWGGSC